MTHRPLLALVAVLSLPAYAQGLPDATGGVEVNGQTAANEDATALVVNPAGLAFVEGLELSMGAFGRIPVTGGGPSQTNLDTLVAVSPMGGMAFGFGTGVALPTSGLPTWWTSSAISIAADRTLSTGLALRTVTPLLGGGSTHWMVDVGTQIRPMRFFAFGAAVEGLGNPDAPATARLGLSVRPVAEYLTLGVDARVIPGDKSPLAGGYLGLAQVVPAVAARLQIGGLAFGLGASVSNLGFVASSTPTVEVLGSVEVDTAHIGASVVGGAGGLLGSGLSGVAGLRVRASSVAWQSILPDSGRWLLFPLTGDGVLVNDSDNFLDSLFNEQPSPTFILAALKNASEDPSVEGIVIELRGMSLGWGRAAELRASLAALKAAGKKVVIHMDGGDDVDVFIASIADKVYLTPAGQLELNGLRAEMTYFGDTLGKIGIHAEAIHAGKYKSAPRTFTANEPNEQELEVENALLDEAFKTLVSGIAAGRGLTEEDVKATIDLGGLTGNRALEKKIIDGLAYDDEIEKKLEDMQGHPVHLEEHFFDREERDVRWDSPPKIALVPIMGAITMGRAGPGLPLFGGGGNAGADDIVDAIDEAAEDDSVKVIVLRIDSPGGDALASDLIWRAVMNAKAKKPVIASMGDVAASGGYYIAAAATSIWAEPDTITGSIGVFGLLFEGEELADKLGVRSYELGRGALPGPSVFRPLSDAERASMQEHVDATYERFLDAVMEGRGTSVGLSRETLREIAEGRVWTGNQAKERKLVDNIGGVLEALEAARAQVNIEKDEPVSLEVLTGHEDDLPGMMGLARVLSPDRDAGVRQAVRLFLGDPNDTLFVLENAGRPLALTPARISIR